MKICKVEKCGKKIHAKSFCLKHYRRIQRNGSLTPKGGYTRDSDLTLKDKFEKSYQPVTESGCWIWDRFLNWDGYGRICHDNKRKMAHNISYELYKGKIEDNFCVLHKCDTPSCVNPDHLFLGTRKDNNDDKMKKGRHKALSGPLNGNAKLSYEDINNILDALSKGKRIYQLAKEYSVTRNTIARVRDRAKKAA